MSDADRIAELLRALPAGEAAAILPQAVEAVLEGAATRHGPLDAAAAVNVLLQFTRDLADALAVAAAGAVN
jgi:hypothetical protein